MQNAKQLSKHIAAALADKKHLITDTASRRRSVAALVEKMIFAQAEAPAAPQSADGLLLPNRPVNPLAR